jgi:protein-S-isoprenylcysteine O-methyltransferase Ste14
LDGSTSHCEISSSVCHDAPPWLISFSSDRMDFHMRSNRSLWDSVFLALRSLLWAVLLPGFIVGYVPWRFFGLSRLRLNLFSPQHVIGLLCVGVGGGLLISCIWAFARRGRGTLAPVDPPQELVVRGLYRYVRNPMYLSVTTILLGEALVARSHALLLYWAIWFVAANLFVIGYEEPALRRRFGKSYELYTRQVGRWLPHFRRGLRNPSNHSQSLIERNDFD